MKSNPPMLSPFRFIVLAAGLAATSAIAVGANDAIDWHPELKSRAVAWTEFDGSYLFDTSDRAQMLDVFWNVFSKPYPDRGWTGTVNPPVAGTTSPIGRQREYSQLNAYRHLNGSPSVTEDASRLPFVQAGALVFAQNPDKEITHGIDNTWVGYNATAADAAHYSLLTAGGLGPFSGAVDAFVADDTLPNASAVGHRMYTLHDNSTSATIGFSTWVNLPAPFTEWNVLLYQPIPQDPTNHFFAQTADPSHYIAYPSNGYFPQGLVHYVARWSFVPADDWTEFLAGTYAAIDTFEPGLTPKDTTVTAKLNGIPVAVHNLVRNGAPGPLTWDFDGVFDPETVPDGSAVEVTIHDVAIRQPPADEFGEINHVIGYRDYQYTVRLFDENKIVDASYSPQTPLVNISTRSVIGNGDNQMIAGFTVSGSLPVRVALRTQGPGLARYGIQNAARSTHIRLYDADNNLLGENSGWKTHPNWRMLQSYNVAPSSDAEAGMVVTLWPGRYTAVVGDDTGANGVGIVEAFNIDSLTPAKLVNLSTRGLVGSDDNQMIAGIIIKDTPRTVVIRTQGPGLARYGVTNPVMDTVLKVVAQSDGHVVAQNDDWKSEAGNARLLTDLSSFAPSDAREAALILTLPPGAYTALVSSKGAAGVGIVEVFDVSPP